MEIKFEWLNVEEEAGKPYRFPAPLTAYLRRSFQKPGVYRWLIQQRSGAHMSYVGEAENIARRLNGYLCPGKLQATNLRLRALLDTELSANSSIQFQLLTFGCFSINNCEFSEDHLSNPYARKMIENLAIALDATDGTLILNKGRDLLEKKKDELRKLLSHISTEEQEHILKFLKTQRQQPGEVNNSDGG